MTENTLCEHCGRVTTTWLFFGDMDLCDPCIYQVEKRAVEDEALMDEYGNTPYNPELAAALVKRGLLK